MIQVTYYREENRVTIEGHAKSGEPGRDLICAGCSILAHTLAVNVQELDNLCYGRDCVTELEPGRAEIRLTPREGYKALVTMLMDSVVVGFEIMARKSPEFVRYRMDPEMDNNGLPG